MKIWTIILAAGAGSRFGGPKALADWAGATLLERAVSQAADPDKVVIVTGAHAIPIPTFCKTVFNARWEEGMGTSISAGISYAQSHEADLALVVPVDQPFVTMAHLGRLTAASLRDKKCVLTQDADIIGPPAAIPKDYFERLKNLGRVGLKSVLPDYSLCRGDGMLLDIDTPEDLARLTAMHREAGK